MITTQMSPRVVAVASVLKQFSRQELKQLLVIVPALQEQKSQESERNDDEALVAHFRKLGLEQRGNRSANLSEPFIGGLTYAEYFSLSASQQDAFWEQLFAEIPFNMEAMQEIDVTL